MAVTTLLRDSWSQVSDSGMLQATAGRVLLALSATPDENDWIVLASGASVVTSGAVWCRAVDAGARVVVLAL